ncbi:hypothetical protein P9112_005595 [Eukaryota sp. TZLM1-RC]
MANTDVPSPDDLLDLFYNPDTRDTASGHFVSLLCSFPNLKDDHLNSKESPYIKALLQCLVMKSRCQDEDAVKTAIVAAVTIIKTHKSHHQRSFRENGAFDSVLTSLSCYQNHVIFHLLFHFIVVLLEHSVSNKKWALETGFYDKLSDTILESFSREFLSSRSTLDVLLFLFLERKFLGDKSHIIRNSDGVIFVLKIIPNLEQSAQSYLLTTLVDFSSSSSHNRSFLCHSGAVDVIINLITSSDPDHESISLYFSLLESLASHSLSVSQLKMLFSLLKSKSINNQIYRPSLYHQVLNLLCGTALIDHEGPISFFGFDGVSSGIQVPVIDKWLSGGWGISMWFKIGSFVDSVEVLGSQKFEENLQKFCHSQWNGFNGRTVNNKVQGSNPGIVLFSFMTEQGEGIKCTIAGEERQICLIITSKNPKRKTVKIFQATLSDFELFTGKWYHFSITQPPKSLTSSKPCIDVYLNGQLVNSIKSKYLSVASALTRNFIGFNLCGALGPFYLFNCFLHPQQAKALFLIGPQYDFTFNPNEFFIDYSTYSQSDQSDLIFQKEEINQSSVNMSDHLLSLSCNVYLSYSARAVSGNQVFDFAPLGGIKSYRMHGTLLGGSVVTTISNIRQNIFALGGLPVLFPLFTQLDQPIYVTASGQKSGLLLSEKTAVLPQILELLFKLTDRSHANQSTLQSIDGIRVIGFLLQKISCTHLCSTTAILLRKFIFSSINLELRYQVVLFLILDSRIWKSSEFNTHLMVLDFLTKLAFQDGVLFKAKVNGIQPILDLLRRHYSYNDSEVYSFFQIKRLRKKLISLILVMCSSPRNNKSNFDLVEAEDVVSLARYAITTDCEHQSFEMLKIIRAVLVSDRSSVAAEGLSSLGGATPFLSLLKSSCDDVRMTALECIVLLYDITLSSLLFGSSFNETFWFMAGKSICSFPLTKACLTRYFLLLTASGEGFDDVFQESIRNKETDHVLIDYSQIATRPFIYSILISHCTSINYPEISNQNLCHSLVEQLCLSFSLNNSNISLFIESPSFYDCVCDLLYHNWVSQRTPMYQYDTDAGLNGSKTTSLDFDTSSESFFDLTVSFCHLLFSISFEREVGFSANYFRLLLFHAKAFTSERGVFHAYFYPVFVVFDLLLSSLLTKSSFPRVSSDSTWKENLSVFFYLVEEEINLYEQLVHLPAGVVCQSFLIDCNQIIHSIRQRTVAVLSLFSWCFISDCASELEISNERKNLYPRGGFIRLYCSFLDVLLSSCNHTQSSCNSVLRENKAYLLTAIQHSFSGKRLLSSKFVSFLCGSLIKSFREAALVNSSCLLVHFNLLQGFLSEAGEFLVGEFKAKLGDRNPWIPIFKTTSLLFSHPSILSSQSLSPHFDPQEFLRILSSGKWPHFEEIVLNALQQEEFKKTDMTNILSGIESLRKVISFCLLHGTICTRSWLFCKILLNSPDFYSFLTHKDIRLVETFASEWKSSLSYYQVLIHDVFQRESKRLLTASDRLKQEDELTLLAWRRICRMVRHERSPWGLRRTKQDHSSLEEIEQEEEFLRCYNNQIACQSDLFWSLDMTENSSRMRLLLERNFSGSRHEGRVSRGNTRDNDTSDSHSIGQDRIHEVLYNLGAEDDAEDDFDDIDGISQIVAQSESTLLAQKDASSAQKQNISEQSDRTVLVVPCERLSITNIIIGSLKITTKSIVFHETKKITNRQYDQTFVLSLDDADADYLRESSWALNDILAVQGRRYLLSPTALEIFFFDNSSLLLNFNRSIRKKVYSTLCSLRPSNLVSFNSLNAADVIKRSNVTSLWQKRLISNFDYLMFLNTISGRTYHDLSQYPVMPWVIRDYSSKEINLEDPNIYRNFARPIGAQLDDTQKLSKKFDDTKFCDPMTEQYKDSSNRSQYHHAFHYLTPATVLYYLVRLEPFTTITIDYHGRDTFDEPDRMFYDIGQTWSSCLTSPADIRELIPEFFYSDLFLRNVNNVFFGNTSSQRDITNVTLPSWANNDPFLFVKINRAALESEYVSQNIHHWIDLIFGFQQRGDEAAKVFNRYRPHCYYSVAFEKIQNPQLRKSIVNAIREFGQIPVQLFKKPHPTRHTLKTIQNFHRRDQCLNFSLKSLHQISEAISDSILLVRKFEDKVMTLNRTFAFSQHCLTSSFAKTQYSDIGNSLDFLIKDEESLAESMFEISSNGKFLITCNHWDYSFKIFDTRNLSLVCSICRHKDVIVACTLVECANQSFLITASRDTTVMIWDFSPNSQQPVSTDPLHILYGHDDAVISVCATIDLVISGSVDGTIIIHTLSARYIRTIEYPLLSPVSFLLFVPFNCILATSNVDNSLCLFNINGTLLSRRKLNHSVTNMLLYSHNCFSKKNFLQVGNCQPNSYLNDDYLHEFVFLGFADGTLEVWSLTPLNCVKQISKFDSAVVCLCLSDDLKCLLVGLDDGKVAVFGL